MKRVIIATLLVLLVPASAQALTVGTTRSNQCQLNTITQPTRFGLQVPDCVAVRAASVSFLFQGREQIENTQATNTRLPYSNVGTSMDAGNRVRIDFAVFLPERRKHRNRERWRRTAGGKLCERTNGGTTLGCQVIVPVG